MVLINSSRILTHPYHSQYWIVNKIQCLTFTTVDCIKPCISILQPQSCKWKIQGIHLDSLELSIVTDLPHLALITLYSSYLWVLKQEVDAVNICIHHLIYTRAYTGHGQHFALWMPAQGWKVFLLSCQPFAFQCQIHLMAYICWRHWSSLRICSSSGTASVHHLQQLSLPVMKHYHCKSLVRFNGICIVIAQGFSTFPTSGPTYAITHS